MPLSIGDWQIRPFSPGDVDAIARYANNRRVWINLRDGFPHPYTAGDAEKWISFAVSQKPLLNFAIASPGEAIGAIGLNILPDVHRKCAEIGYWIGEPFWGRGICSAALQVLTRYAFRELDLVRIQAAVFEWNPASMKVLEKGGYRQEGRLRKAVFKDGQIIDAVLYAILAEEVTEQA